MMNLLIASATVILFVLPFLVVLAACIAAGRSDQRDEELQVNYTAAAEPRSMRARIAAPNAGD